MPFDNILVALAGMDDEENVIHETVRLVRALESQLTVLHVNDPKAGKVSMMMETQRLVEEEDMRSRFRDLGYNVTADNLKFNIVTGVSLPKVIAEATKGMDLLVIGHRRKNRFLAAFADSADKRLADLVACPVLIVPRK